MNVKKRKQNRRMLKVLNLKSNKELNMIMEYFNSEIFRSSEAILKTDVNVLQTCSQKTPSEREINLYNINALALHFEFIHTVWRNQLYPCLKAIDSPLASKLYDRFIDGRVFLMTIKKTAEKQLLPGEEARIR